MDVFGLPNAAENNLHPKKWTEKYSWNEKAIKGWGSRSDLEVSTCDESYYKHQQEIFIDFFNKGFVKEKKITWIRPRWTNCS